MNESLRALNRFGLGARIGEAARVRDPRRWLLGQLEGDPPAVDATGLPTLEEVGEAQRAQRQAVANPDPAARRAQLATIPEIRQAEIMAALAMRVTTERPFAERLVAFFSNHLCVSMAGRQPVIGVAGLYEREVIRPHLFGSFADMLLASARHPGMLFYLDNFQSIGPDSPQARAAARRQGRERGLNENYARELLELHTLGVGGGYTQGDVEEMAKLLTGWTLTGAGPADREPLGFAFRPALHEPGTRTILGRSYRGDGAERGEAAIRDLANHPSTARFLAGKLVGHFISDDPPPAAVDRISARFLETGGNLRAVAVELVSLEESWNPETRKLRTPQDWLVALLRAAGADSFPPFLAQALVQLRHPIWAPPSPKGYGDTFAEWSDPDGLMNRAELTRTAAERLRTRGLDPARLLEVMELTPEDPLRTLLADPSLASEERIALAFGGPAFQWR